MAFLQDVTSDEFDDALRVMGERHMSLALTVRHHSRWLTFRTQAIARYQQVIWAELPAMDHLAEPFHFKTGEPVGVTFNLGSAKYVFAVKVVCMETYTLADGTEAKAIRLQCDGERHRVERRLHRRHDVSRDERVRARFWLGGCGTSPDAEGVLSPAWSGRVVNFSSGGVLVRCSPEAMRYVDAGDVLGVHILFGPDEPDACVDGQLRHCSPDGDMALLGIQFVESPESEEARESLRFIHQKIRELEKQMATAKARPEPAGESDAPGADTRDGPHPATVPAGQGSVR